jgi:hypothetical protein
MPTIAQLGNLTRDETVWARVPAPQSLGGVDGQANIVHQNPCKICKEYALHVYNHTFDQDIGYLDAKEL